MDKVGNKKHLIIAASVNLLLLIAFGAGIKYPQKVNYPVEITEENKSSAYYKMQLFLGFSAIITSCVFAYMIFKAINYTENYFYFIGALVILPLAAVISFHKKITAANKLKVV